MSTIDRQACTALFITASTSSLRKGNIYRPQISCDQGYVFTRVCDSVHRRGGLPQCMLGYNPPTPREACTPQEACTPPESRHLPGSTHLPGKHAPPPGSMHPPGSKLQHTVNEWPVLLECILVPVMCFCQSVDRGRGPHVIGHMDPSPTPPHPRPTTTWTLGTLPHSGSIQTFSLGDLPPWSYSTCSLRTLHAPPSNLLASGRLALD